MSAKRAAARKRKRIEVGSSVEAAAGFTQGLRDAAIKQFGQEDIPEIDNYLDAKGLSLKSNVALQYVLGIDVLVLGRLLNIIGPPAGGKTQFCLWLARQFMLFPGLFLSLDSEKKVSPSLITSILQFPRERLKKQFIPAHVESMQDLTDKLSWYGQQYSQAFPDKAMPMFMLVDSISGLTGSKALEKYRGGETDENNMQAAHNAKALTDAIKKFLTTYLFPQPLLLALISHQKEKIDMSWSPNKNKEFTTGTGGVHKDFQGSWRLKIETIKRHPSLTSGRKVDHKLFGDKCGMGEDWRYVIYTTHTYMDPETDELVTDFDWDSALVRLLVNDKQTSKEFLKSVIGLAKGDGGFSIKTLKKKELSMREAGASINASPELVKELQRYYRINSGTVFGKKKDHDPEVVETEDDGDGFD